jgi:hypothetical protein
MAFDVLLESVNILSILGMAALVILTTKPCRASGVPYMVAIPAGFGLMTVAFVIQSVVPFVQGSPPLASSVQAVELLTRVYGVLFIAFVYARRTRVRILGESTAIDLLVAALVTLVFLSIIVLTQTYGIVDEAWTNGQFFLRAIVLAASIYLAYETFRNWALTQKASQGIVTVGFTFFVVEQIGFILSMMSLGAVALFLGYEGRIMALFVLNATLLVSVKKDDPIAVMRRLGLVAPVHFRAPEIRLK